MISNNDFPIKVIYHQDCFDGGVAAAIINAAHPGCQITNIPMEYQNEPPVNELIEMLKDSTVVIVDFSLSPAVISQLLPHTNSIVMFDHHETAVRKWDGYSEKYPDLAEALSDGRLSLTLNTTSSGSKLAYKAVKWALDEVNQNLSWALRDLADNAHDYDTWSFGLQHSRNIAEYFYSRPWVYEGDIDSIIKFALELHNQEEKYSALGRVVKEYKRTHVTNTYMKFGGVVEIDGYEVPIVCVPRGWQSMAGDVLSELYPDAPFNVSYFVDFKLNKLVYSLRRTRGFEHEFDVSVIAQRFGGGGHAAAAGFKQNVIRHPLMSDPYKSITSFGEDIGAHAPAETFEHKCLRVKKFVAYGLGFLWELAFGCFRKKK